MYKGLSFRGGDLRSVATTDFGACKEACTRQDGCTFFTIEGVSCRLKSAHVDIAKDIGAISGMTDDACGIQIDAGI